MRASRMLGLIVGALFIVPSIALGGVPVGGTIAVPYGAGYPASDGGTAVHRGVDVVCTAGDTVSSPIDGEVTFVGRVPSAAGGTMLAMSVRAGDDVVSLMPLESARLAKGALVRRGDEVGVVAESGDPSCEATHLHVSLRRNGVYIDPAPLLGTALEPRTEPEADAATPPAVLAQNAVVSDVPAHGAGSSAASGIAAVSILAADANKAHVRVPADGDFGAQGAGRPVAGGEVDRTSVVPEIAPGVSLPASHAEHPVIGSGQEQVPAAAAESLVKLAMRAASPVGAAAIIAAVVAVALVFSRRAIERRIQSNPPVSDRFGSMLQHLRAGDTLCGLTSCSGLLPSQSRGRLAQRR